MSKPEPPTPPSPTATAAAQTGTNVSTAIANAYLNNVSQNTPDGTLRYDVTGNYNWTDPISGQQLSVPQFTSTQALSPQGQALKAQNDATKLNLATMGNTQSGRIASVLSSPFNPAQGSFNANQYLQQNPDVMAYAQQHGLDPASFAQQHYQQFGGAEGRASPITAAPTAGSAAGLQGVGQARTSFDQGPGLQTSFGGAGDITRSYGPGDFSQDRQSVQDALMQRMNPSLQQDTARLQQQLADQGIRYGSDAYNAAMLTNSQRTNDARLGAISQAGQEQQRMMDMAAQRAGFENSAQQQAYEQQLGRGTFANQAAGQQFQQNAAAATFENAGLAQQLAQQQAIYNAQNSQRNQFMQEQYQQRNQPLNEISALLSGSQVQQPNWLNSPTSQIPTTDFAGITNSNFQNQMNIYNTQQNAWNSTLGGVLGLGAAAIKSDRREKENIGKIGTVFAANDSDETSKLPIYSYSYKDDPASTRHIGPMAQDVEKITPDAVTSIRGVKHIYPAKVMGSILRAA